jgi:hypothetical protein
VLGGALAGGALGYLAFFWLAGHGFYGLVLPGGLLGLGAGVARNRSVALAVVCGLLATALGLFARWQLGNDGTFGDFLLHVHQLSPPTLLMIAVGGAIGFWVPFRRIEPREPTGDGGGKAKGGSA